ncbi:unnamed protein product [Dovyalis caffra]|uniref:DUF4219 domain-containing protein n=1 Tax=Dovyalis caffra TaxID=77055 RepID=A0AAV1RQZ0_9ROSI|nr:unnamed protein product [Dovyalis caffra]
MSMANAIVPETLRHGNYDSWSAWMKNYLLAQDLWDLIESPSGTEPPNQEVAKEEYKAWRKKNATALHAIQICCWPYMNFKTELSTDSAKIAWDNLANSYRKPLPLPVPKGNAGKFQIPDSDSDFDEFDDTDSDFDTDNGTGKVKDDYTQFAGLADSVYRGDWHSTMNFLDRHPGVINSKINSFGRTVLHMATITGNVEIGEKLVKLMSKGALAIQDVDGNTALHYAACRGAAKMARHIVEKNDTLVTIANKRQYIPIASACASGYRDATIYLLSVTPLEVLSLDNGIHGSLLLRHAITSKMLGKNCTTPR